jgi:hypothetical protein
MARRFRDLYKHLVPAWLYTGEGEMLLHAWATILDASVQRMLDGLEARFPSRAGEDALRLLGQDRGIPRGRDETSAHYAERLKGWRFPRGHRVRGSAYALLNQVSEYFGGVRCWTVDVKGTIHERTADGVETTTYGNAWDWDAGASLGRYRFWVVVDVSTFATENPDFGNSLLWGGALGTPGYTIGQIGVLPGDGPALRNLMRGVCPWRPAGTQPEWVVLSLDGTFAPTDGNEGVWSVEGGGAHRQRSRDADYRYISLDPAHNNTYAGDSTLFSTTTTLPAGTIEGGDPTSFPASTTLPDGTAYAGDPASFPTSVRLLDDGDPP